MRTHDRRPVFVRRSRGYAPAPVMLKRKAKYCAVGLGGELNNTACVLNEGKAFVSQHIGDVENVETRDFLQNAITHLIRLTNSKVEIVTCDLHPKFTTTKLANDLAEENAWHLLQVQHHFAHIAALMAEHNIEEIVGICCDGYGYGLNGEAWGGEIILSAHESSPFKRVAHLENQPLVGGDLATRYPLRMATGILHKTVNVKDWLQRNKTHFPHDEKEIQMILHQLEQNQGIIETSSCGRVLDAVAAVLGICHERTYEGEPAMKLESAAIKGKDTLHLEPIMKDDTLDTTQMITEIFENKEKQSTPNLAYSAHAYLAKGLATLAIEKAVENDIKTIGFSGGAANNEILIMIIRETVKNARLQFLVHEAIPAGDGGLSFGQTAVAGFFSH